MKTIHEGYYAFDDVLCIPTYTERTSRLGGDVTTSLGPVKLGLPLISSPMDTVTEAEMAIAIGKAGGMGIIHRFMSPLEQGDQLEEVLRAKEQHPSIRVVPAIGVTLNERQRIMYLHDRFGSDLDMICVDIANGHSKVMAEMIEFIKEYISDEIPIMAGNVATGEGFHYLAKLGVDAVRVGIGGGSICKTRIQTGFGVPTFASILDCQKWKEEYGHHSVSIVADGGIRDPQDLIKSLVAGADAVMCGSIFAGTQESPGKEIETNDGKKWKEYRGMASEEVQIDRRGGMKPGTCAEGVSTLTPYKGSLKRVINDFAGGLRSAFTYANASNIVELRRNSEFIRITEAGVSESHAFGTRK